MTRKNRVFRGVFLLVMAAAMAGAAFETSWQAWTRLTQYRQSGGGVLFDEPPGPGALVFVGVVAGLLLRDDIDAAPLRPGLRTAIRNSLRLVVTSVVVAVLCFVLTAFATDTTRGDRLTGAAFAVASIATAVMAATGVILGMGFLRGRDTVEGGGGRRS